MTTYPPDPTVRNARKPIASKDAKVAKPEHTPFQDEDAADPENGEAKERWQRSLSAFAGDAIAMEAYWTKTFGSDWRYFVVPSDLKTLAKQASEAWATLLTHLI